MIEHKKLCAIRFWHFAEFTVGHLATNFLPNEKKKMIFTLGNVICFLIRNRNELHRAIDARLSTWSNRNTSPWTKYFQAMMNECRASMHSKNNLIASHNSSVSFKIYIWIPPKKLWKTYFAMVQIILWNGETLINRLVVSSHWIRATGLYSVNRCRKINQKIWTISKTPNAIRHFSNSKKYGPASFTQLVFFIVQEIIVEKTIPNSLNDRRRRRKKNKLFRFRISKWRKFLSSQMLMNCLVNRFELIDWIIKYTVIINSAAKRI